MLDIILDAKREELAQTRAAKPLHELKAQMKDEPVRSLSAALQKPEINIIAEIKYCSPSHGDFDCRYTPEDMAKIYVENGAAAISVLTEKKYFKGDIQFLRTIRDKLPETPLLRKDFLIDPYQVVEARAYGASACLLIVACLEKRKLAELIDSGRQNSVEPLVEVHDLFELDRAVAAGAKLVGVNNRDLKTFKVDLKTSFRVARQLEGENGYTLVSESGISEQAQILELKDAGYKGFLIGSSLMQASDPGAKLRELTGQE